MHYSVKEMSEKLGVPPSTLRFYDKEGLLPFVERTSGGARQFKDEDFEWLKTIESLKKTGMQLKEIKSFIQMALDSDKTIKARLDLIVKQKNAVLDKIEELNQTLLKLEFKQWYYETALADQTTENVRNMPNELLPEKFRTVRKELRGK